VVVPREDHRISRRDIDSDALRVLYRLNQHRFAAYLVGGSVRDLLLGRRPKDFDKRLFRNCWIIGRRFRLAHIKFGPKTIEVATFRKIVPEAEPEPVDAQAVVVASAGEGGVTEAEAAPFRPEPGPVHRDNTFGTPEEDAFRRDFTINGLFYDIATRSVIDFVGGLTDLEHRVVRSIGDPRVRFVEDPVRMFRAAVFAARLGFDMDPLVIEAIAEHRHLIRQASPARLMEEYFKVLRSGFAEPTFRALDRVRLLELITPELAAAPDTVWDSLAKLDSWRQRFPSAPLELTNTVLIGALLVPLGHMQRPIPGPDDPRFDPRGEKLSFGMLPVARKDLERLRQLVQTVPRLVDPALPPRVARSLPHRPAFPDSVTWVDVFGNAPDVVERWQHLRHVRPEPRHHRGPRPHLAPTGRAPETIADVASPEAPGEAALPHRRRRRRRRRGRRGRGGGSGGGQGPAA
jgi:poly(A) polymerase